MRIVLLGAPGSGKKTLTRLLVEKYGIPPIYTGQLQKEAQVRAVKESNEEPQPAAEEMVLDLIRDRLMQPDTGDGFILEGFPRNIIQAITLDEVLAEMNMPVELALLIDLDTDALMERLVGRRTCSVCGTLYNIYSHPSAVEDICDLCGGRLRHRADDNEETVSGRLHVYEHFASNLIKHYTRQNKLKRVDGFGGVEEVLARVCAIIDSFELSQVRATAPGEMESQEARRRIAPLAAEPVDPVPAEEPESPALDIAVARKRSAAKKVGKKSASARRSQAAKRYPAGKQSAKAKSAQAARKASAKAAGKKTVSKKKAAKKGVKKTAVKKRQAPKGKAAARKPIAKKRHTKKVVVKQAAVKKSAAKKSLVKKASAKKPGAKRSTLKKQVAAKKKVAKKQLVKQTKPVKKQAKARKKSNS